MSAFNPFCNAHNSLALLLTTFVALAYVGKGGRVEQSVPGFVKSEAPREPDPLPGKSIVTIRLGIAMSPAGYIGPGTRIDILASVRFGKRLEVFPLLLDVAIVEIKRDEQCSISVDRTQALLIELALFRNCELGLLLRNPDEPTAPDKLYDPEEVLRYLANKGHWLCPGQPEEMPVPRWER